MKIQQQSLDILEEYGKKTADKAVTMLLEDPALKKIETVVKFVSKSWRDPLTPAMINLSCQAVGGKPEETQDIAIAISYMNLSFRVWDDMIDKTVSRQFKPTLVGKFGESNALIFGGILSAKAFTIINQLKIDFHKRQKISILLWNYWAKMAATETINQKQKLLYTADEKFAKIKAEAVNLETCLSVGGLLGDGSDLEVKKLAQYGRCLGIVLELFKDLRASLNLTVELEEKIKNKTLTLTLLRAREQSETLKNQLSLLSRQQEITSSEIKFVTDLMLQTDSIWYIEGIMKRNVETAKKALSNLEVKDVVKKLGVFIEAQVSFFKEFQ